MGTNRQQISEKDWSEIIRVAITSDTRTMYALAQQAGIEQSQLTRFMAGKSINLTTANQLGSVLGLDLVKSGEATSKQARKKSLNSGKIAGSQSS